MKFGNMILSAVICSMMTLNMPAMAAPVRSAEFDLVRSISALSGQKLSAEDAKAALATSLTKYKAAAVADGQQDTRFVQALVDNKVYSADQAQALFTDSMNSSARAVNAGASSDAIAAEVSRLAQSRLAGSQFSGCGFAGGAVLLGGVGAVIAGVVLSTRSSSTCTTGFDGSVTCVGGSSSGHNTDLTRDLYIGGAIGIAAGALLLVGAAAGC